MPGWRQRHPRLADALVCKGLLPWSPIFLPSGADLGQTLQRFRAQGIDHGSLSAASGKDDHCAALSCLGWLRHELRNSAPTVRMARGADDIRQATADGAMSASCRFRRRRHSGRTWMREHLHLRV
jgi:membrane dipeptidase